MHRIGDRTGLDAYKNISESSWIPDLKRLGMEFGFAFLLQDALDFEQWFVGKWEANDPKVTKGKCNPRSRFLVTRMSNNRKWPEKQALYTAGDTEHSFPDTTAASIHSAYAATEDAV